MPQICSKKNLAKDERAFVSLAFKQHAFLQFYCITCFQEVDLLAVFTETPSQEDVIGGVSLVVWTITSLVLVKYALIVLRADDNGQGYALSFAFCLSPGDETAKPDRRFLNEHVSCKAISAPA